MRTPRLLLCRPSAGLFDLLCQIDKACRYAEQTDRLIVVDTNFHSTKFFKDDFSKYFVSRQPHLRLDPSQFATALNELAVFPKVIFGNINAYSTEFDFSVKNFVEKESREILSFDFSQNYSEPLLVHHAGGRDGIALATLGRIRLRDEITDILLDRLRSIGSPYTAIHIRDTDYRTDYQQAIERLKSTIRGPIFLATDNRNSLDFLRSIFGEDRVFSFANLPLEAGKPPHIFDEGQPVYEVNRDAIVDLLMLGLSREFHFFPLSKNQFGARYSGYSIIANQLRQFPSFLSNLIARCDDTLDKFLPIYRL